MNIGTLPENVDTLIVGAGHAGLTMSALLKEAKQEHLLLERRTSLGGGWQDRWDAFTVVTPNWVSSFPGWAYDGPDPDSFMSKDRIVERVAQYADVIDAPVALGTEVRRMAPQGDGSFKVETNRGELTAREVVVATGSYHTSRVPALAAEISPRITQLHSHDYHNEAALPDGAVLIVGTGQTGVQLAEEMTEAGRKVYLAVGRSWRAPRRYRGRDIFGWLAQIAMNGAQYGVGLPSADQLPDPTMKFLANPHVSGQHGGHDTNLRRFAAEGMTLAGRLTAADGERVTFAPDLGERLAFADGFFDQMLRGKIDTFIQNAGIEAPPDDRVPFLYQPPELTELDLSAAGISTIIWATGYGLDFGWIDAPIFEARGYPTNKLGVSPIPGLYFLGLLWQRGEPSATLVGPRIDGPHLVEQMAYARV